MKHGNVSYSGELLAFNWPTDITHRTHEIMQKNEEEFGIPRHVQ
jgi:hypothetical protein